MLKLNTSIYVLSVGEVSDRFKTLDMKAIPLDVAFLGEGVAWVFLDVNRSVKWLKLVRTASTEPRRASGNGLLSTEGLEGSVDGLGGSGVVIGRSESEKLLATTSN